MTHVYRGQIGLCLLLFVFLKADHKRHDGDWQHMTSISAFCQYAYSSFKDNSCKMSSCSPRSRSTCGHICQTCMTTAANKWLSRQGTTGRGLQELYIAVGDVYIYFLFPPTIEPHQRPSDSKLNLRSKIIAHHITLHYINQHACFN